MLLDDFLIIVNCVASKQPNLLLEFVNKHYLIPTSQFEFNLLYFFLFDQHFITIEIIMLNFIKIFKHILLI
jgi:hypothetical protein